MKTHTNNFKDQIKRLGREIDSKVTYTLNNEQIELGASQLNSITPSFKAELLKSVMKELEIDCNVEIPIGTILTYQFGLKVDGAYEYLNYGNYIVNEVEKQEDTNSYIITCYDKMLYAMKDYETINILEPVTIRTYIGMICQRLNLTFANANDEFCNFDKLVTQDLFSEQGLTYRDILDQVAEVTGSMVCINNNDELELRYINKTDSGASFEIDGETTQEQHDAKNLNVYPYTGTTSEKGITFTQNSDGTLILNGRNDGTGNSLFYFYNNNSTPMYFDAGTYYIIPPDSDSVTFYLTADGETYLFNSNNNYSFTFDEEFGVTKFYLQVKRRNTTQFDNMKVYPMVSTLPNQTKDDYEPYSGGVPSPNPNQPEEIIGKTGEQTLTIGGIDYNIDLGDLVLYENDAIKRSAGKNLFDKDNSNYLLNNVSINPNTSVVSYANGFYTIKIPCKASTTYTISKVISTRFSVAYGNNVNYTSGEILLGKLTDNTATSLTITTGENAKSLYVFYSKLSDETTYTLQQILDSIQIEYGNQATTYEPYLEKGTWYLERNNRYTELLVSNMNNSEAYPGWKNVPNLSTDYPSKNSNFLALGVSYYSNINIQPSAYPDAVAINTNSQSTLFLHTGFWGNDHTQTYWKTNYPNLTFKILYELETPIFSVITDETLLNQLRNVTLDIITPQYLKDINVKFGEKFGPINSIVLSRAAESDNIYLRDEESVTQNGLCEVKIRDNQFMNFNDRDQYLPDLLSTLDGIEYYMNDFSSTGIAYYDLGDLYRINIDDNSYKCLMLNDTLEISQGISEDIFTDHPTNSETDYKKSDKTDNRINQAYIIVDKQNQQIEALTSQVTTITGEVGNSYTKEEVNQLIQNASSGITNNFINSGGNNLLRNTGLWFEDRSEIDYIYPNSSGLYPSDDLYMSADPHWEFWKGNAKKIKEDKASNLSGILLQTGQFEQTQQVRNGTYTLSFKYRKLISTANVNVQINDRQIILNGNDDTEIIEVGNITTQNISIKFSSDWDDSCIIYDLMLNAGTEKAEYSQHQNETTTDTVNISKGITIQSSDTNTTFKANSDGIRVYNSKDMDNPVTEYTDTGMDINRVNIKEEARVLEVLWKNVGNNTWITRL